MKCKTIHKKLIFYIEGDLPENEMQEVGVHISGCRDCASFAAEIKKTLSIVHLEKQTQVSPFFYTRLKARMDRQQEAQVRHRNIPLWESILQPAFFSVLLLAGIYTGIKIGGQAVGKDSSPVYAEMEVIPFLNEMHSEPLESFLMEQLNDNTE
jgi:anti-sigma factor RsiW